MHRCFAPLYRSYFKYAAVAQLVESQISNLIVAGSCPVCRSTGVREQMFASPSVERQAKSAGCVVRRESLNCLYMGM